MTKFSALYTPLPGVWGYIIRATPANQVNIIKWTSNYNITSKIWTPIWGDGIKVDKEECDDNNTSNGDGCSNVCKIEQGFQWIIDSSGKKLLSKYKFFKQHYN